jgi:hypothetical protein
MYGYPILTIPLPADEVKSYLLKINIPQSYTGPSDADELGTIYTAYIPINQVSTLASQIQSLQSTFYHGLSDQTAQQLAACVVSTFSVTSPSDSTQAGNPRPPKMNVAVIVGATFGALSLLIASVHVTLFIRRRNRFRLLGSDMEPFTLNASSFASESQANQAFPSDEERPIPLEEAGAPDSRRLSFSRGSMVRQHPIDPFTLIQASILASDSQIEQTFSSDEKRPIPPEETETSESLEASNSPSPTDASSASNLTPSILSTIRQQRLQEQGQASAMQLACLEERTGSSEWVSRVEYDVVVGEMTRLRAEMSWIRDAQQSGWALGLSDEMPPPYSHSGVNSG